MILTRTYFVLTSILMLSVLCVGQVGAAGDTVVIQQQVISADAEPPSVPANLTATAVATTQIDLSWDASTDNVAVDGYQVFRDNVQIASTTLTTYSDVGLTPATLYAYRVTAYDAALNFSTSSATSSATTLSVSTTPPSGGGNAYVPDDIKLVSFRVVADEYSVRVIWETSAVTRSKLQWGETASYELGSLSERTFTKWHETTISGLSPGTRYELLLTSEGSFGNVATFADSFITKALPDTTPPPNVRDFSAQRAGDDVVLTWANPDVSDFDRVRVVHGNDFYPVDPFDGAVVYEGTAESAFDAHAGDEDGTHYYTAFVYDKAGNVSSGAVAFVFVGEDGLIALPPEDTEPVLPSFRLELSDFSFVQGGKEIVVVGDSVEIKASSPFTISIPYDHVPENLKTILVTVSSPHVPDQSFSFLLRVNDRKTAYSATIDALGIGGVYPLSLTLFNYANQTLTKVTGALVVEGPEERAGTEEFDGFLAQLGKIITGLGLWLLVLMLILLILAYYALRDDRRPTHHRHVYLS